MRKYQNLIIAITLVICSMINYSTVFAQYYQKVYGGSGNDVIKCVKYLPDGSIIMGGYTTGFGSGQKDVLIMRSDAFGNIYWSKVFGGANNEECYSLIYTSDGNIVICGYTESYGGGNIDGLLLKMNLNGLVMWSKAFGDGGNDYIYDIIEYNGEIITAGKTNSYGAGGYDCEIICVNSQGTLQWARVIGETGDEVLKSVVPATGGNFVFAGTTSSFGNSDEILVMEIDTGGNLLWFNSYGGVSIDVATNIVNDNSTGFLINGYTYSYGSGLSDIIAIKINAAGNVTWANTYGGAMDDAGLGIVRQTSGDYILSAFTQSFGAGNNDILSFSIDNSGIVQWAFCYGDVGQDGGVDWPGENTGKNIQTDLSQSFLYTADVSKSYGSGDADVILLRSDMSGEIPQCTTSIVSPSRVAQTINASSQTTQLFVPTGFEHTFICPALNASLSLVYDCGCSINVDLGNDTIVCSGNSLVFNPGEGFAQYLWQDSSTNQTYTANTQGYYSVMVTDSNGCIVADTVFLTVFSNEEYAIGDDSTYMCYGDTLFLDAGAGFDYYLWQNGNNTRYQTVTSSGIYSVSVSGDCGITMDSIVVIYFPQIVLELGKDTNICQGNSLVIGPGGGYEEYLWQDGSDLPLFIVVQEGEYSLLVTDSFGCSAFDKLRVTYQELPEVDLGEDLDICDKDHLFIDAGTGIGQYYYIWSTGEVMQGIQVNYEGVYAVTVTNACGSESDSVEVIGCPDCIAKVPTAFSPNSDGNNDILYIRGSGFSRVRMQVYNRQGQLMFETDDPDVGWNGRFNGIMQECDTYYYYLIINCQSGDVQQVNGDFILLK